MFVVIQHTYYMWFCCLIFSNYSYIYIVHYATRHIWALYASNLNMALQYGTPDQVLKTMVPIGSRSFNGVDFKRDTITLLVSLICVDDLGWRTLEQRRADSRLALLFKIYNGLIPVDAREYLRHPTLKIPALSQLQLRSFIYQYLLSSSFFENTNLDWV